jgi:type III secretory pathway component EscU
VSGGNIELVVPYDQGVFYKSQIVPVAELEQVPVVSAVQLYMDLFRNPARGAEQAEHLREIKLMY